MNKNSEKMSLSLIKQILKTYAGAEQYLRGLTMALDKDE
jgi:hypothetical protein